MKCPKCGSEVKCDYSNFMKPFYFCEVCAIPFTDWQQSLIDSQAAKIERLERRLSNETPTQSESLHPVETAPLKRKIAELEAQIKYEQERNQNNVSNADLQIKELSARLADTEELLSLASPLFTRNMIELKDADAEILAGDVMKWLSMLNEYFERQERREGKR